MGAALFTGHAVFGSAAAVPDPADGCIALSGIAIRSEQIICSDRSASQTAQEGARIPCGATVAVLSNGDKISAPCSAIFFRETDGYETLTPDMLLDLSPERLETLLNTPPAPSAAIGRIVCDSVWYYAAFSDADFRIPEDRDCALCFDGTEEWVSARLISVSNASDGKRAAVFRLNCGGNYLSLRHVSAKALFLYAEG